MVDEILLFKPYADERDIEAVTKVIKRGSYWADGPEIDEFEKRIADYVGRKHAAAFSSGSSALYATLVAHGIRGGEVILPSYTFVATASTIVSAGARPVFADIEPRSLGLDVADVEKKMSSQTRAIIPVHIAGKVCKDINALRELADEHRIPLIEDAAHGMGVRLGDKHTGTFGSAAMLSFAQNKVISLGQGGMAVTDSQDIYDGIRSVRAHGLSPVSKEYASYGFNLRMTCISAALGLSQLSKLEWLISRRREIASYISEGLKGLEDLTLPDPEEHRVFLFYNLMCRDEATRNSLRDHLKSNKIPSRVTYPPIHLFDFYRRTFGCKEGDLPVTESTAKRILTIPCYPALQDSQVEFIVDKVKEHFYMR